MTRIRNRGLQAVVLLATVAGACSLFSTEIDKITKDPRSYDNQIVVVRGEVTGSINFLLINGFTLRDKTGQISIITDGAVPRTGETVRVKGRVQQAFALGTNSLVVIRDER